MSGFRSFLCFTLLVFAVLFVSCGGEDNAPTNTENVSAPAGMILIPSANQTFTMGSASGLEDESPPHSVTFSRSFWMDSTEVTQGEYDELMSQYYEDYTTPTWTATYGYGSDYPAYHLYWSDAVLFCNAKSKRDGLDTVYSYASINGTPGNLCELIGVESDLSLHGFRLPTEAEWEFACRGGQAADFFWGENYDPYPVTSQDTLEVGSYAIWYETSYVYGADTSLYGSQPVAGRLVNGFGLHDMTGNLYEWCHDWYAAYSGGSETDPSGPVSGDWHCLRGGSWGSDVYYLRSSSRTFSFPDYIYYAIGFRTVLADN